MENYLKAARVCFFLALWIGFTETNVSADILNWIQVREIRLSPPGPLNRGYPNQSISQTGLENQDQGYMKRTKPGKAPSTPGNKYPKSPHYKTLVRVTGTDPVYWLQNGKLYWVITPDIINQMLGLPGWGIHQIQNYSASVLNTSRYVTGPRFISTDGASNGLYIRKAGETEVYRISNGRKAYVSDDSCNQTNCWKDIIEVTQPILDMFVTLDTPKVMVTGNPISAGTKIGIWQNGLWYLDQNGNRIWEGCTTDKCVPYGLASDIPLIGDWTGKGYDSVGIYRPSDSSFRLKNSNSGGIADINFWYGIPGDVPIAGDWTGKGYDSVGVYRPSNSSFYLKNSNSSGVEDLSFQYGIPGDIPIVGDWTGKGYTSMGVYRPSACQFLLKNSNTSGVADITFTYGIPGDIPIVGDWDGDGVDTVGVYRPSDGKFYLKNSHTSGVPDEVANFGILNRKPLTGRW